DHERLPCAARRGDRVQLVERRTDADDVRIQGGRCGVCRLGGVNDVLHVVVGAPGYELAVNEHPRLAIGDENDDRLLVRLRLVQVLRVGDRPLQGRQRGGTAPRLRRVERGHERRCRRQRGEGDLRGRVVGLACRLYVAGKREKLQGRVVATRRGVGEKGFHS